MYKYIGLIMGGTGFGLNDISHDQTHLVYMGRVEDVG